MTNINIGVHGKILIVATTKKVGVPLLEASQPPRQRRPKGDVGGRGVPGTPT